MIIKKFLAISISLLLLLIGLASSFVTAHGVATTTASSEPLTDSSNVEEYEWAAVSTLPPGCPKPLTDPSEAIPFDQTARGKRRGSYDNASPEAEDHVASKRSIISDNKGDTSPIEAPQVEAHPYWGTFFDSAHGAFAQQSFYTWQALDIDTGDGDNTLYAPTLTCPEPCPFESVTAYYDTGNHALDARWRIYDFSAGNFIGSGISFNSQEWDDYAFWTSGDGGYYYTCIFRDDNEYWHVYLWDHTQGTGIWVEQCTAKQGTNRDYDAAWDMFEVYGYDEDWANLEIPTTWSQNLMIYRLHLIGWPPVGFWIWDFANFPYAYEESAWWGVDPFPMFYYAHDFTSEFDTWYVESPRLRVAAVDNYGYPADVGVYVDGEFVGYTGFSSITVVVPTVGSHTLGFTVEGYGLTGYVYFQYFVFDNGAPHYQNPDTIWISRSKSALGYYSY